MLLEKSLHHIINKALHINREVYTKHYILPEKSIHHIINKTLHITREVYTPYNKALHIT
jgi:hypothetical protein